MSVHAGPSPADSPATSLDALRGQWLALHEAAGIVAALAGTGVPACEGGPDAFPRALQRAGGWRLALGRQAMADLAAILEGGIRALLVVHAGGTRPAAAARALWDEFAAAREGLIALLPPEPGPETRW